MPNTKAFDRAFTKLIENFESEKKKVIQCKDKTIIKFRIHTMKDLTRCTIILESVDDNIEFNELFEKQLIKSEFKIIQIKNMF
jgi:hypothetical protein